MNNKVLSLTSYSCLHISSFGNLISSKNFQSSLLLGITYLTIHWIPLLGSLIVILNVIYLKLYPPFMCKTSVLGFLCLCCYSPTHPNPKPQSSLTSTSITTPQVAPAPIVSSFEKITDLLHLLHYNFYQLSDSIIYLFLSRSSLKITFNVSLHLIQQHMVQGSII